MTCELYYTSIVILSHVVWYGRNYVWGTIVEQQPNHKSLLNIPSKVHACNTYTSQSTLPYSSLNLPSTKCYVFLIIELLLANLCELITIIVLILWTIHIRDINMRHWYQTFATLKHFPGGVSKLVIGRSNSCYAPWPINVFRWLLAQGCITNISWSVTVT